VLVGPGKEEQRQMPHGPDGAHDAGQCHRTVPGGQPVQGLPAPPRLLEHSGHHGGDQHQRGAWLEPGPSARLTARPTTDERSATSATRIHQRARSRRPSRSRRQKSTSSLRRPANRSSTAADRSGPVPPRAKSAKVNGSLELLPHHAAGHQKAQVHPTVITRNGHGRKWLRPGRPVVAGAGRDTPLTPFPALSANSADRQANHHAPPRQGLTEMARAESLGS
jgi:hypothetical protein